MKQESQELKTARAALSEAESRLESPEIVSRFRQGIDSLAQVIFGDYSEAEKKIAKSLADSYRRKIITRSMAAFSNAASLELASIEQWKNLIETFQEAGLGDDAELISCANAVVQHWGLRLLKSMRPWQIEQLKKELFQTDK